MSTSPGSQEPTDGEILDRIFDEALESCANGVEPDVSVLVGVHVHLRESAEEVLRTVRLMAVQAPRRPAAIPGYEIIATLGRGGGGTVFLARQKDLGRPVALKILGAAATASERGRERFRAEARALGKLRHPGVVAIHEVLEQDGILAYAMEWIEGRSLDVALRRNEFPCGAGAPRHVGVVRLIAAAGRALQAVHDAGVLHRDLKPSNILLRPDGTPVLADFGLARDADRTLGTEVGHFLGTAVYAAPEQLRGDVEVLDARTDVYGLGATLFDALTGRPPFPASTVAGVLLAIESQGPPRLRAIRRELPRDLATVVATAMAPEPADRYPSAAAFADDLDRILTLRPIAARPVPWTRRAGLLVRRRRASLAAAGLAAAVVAIVAWFIAGEAARRAEERRTLPERVAAKLREARILLLDPEHGEYAFADAHGRPPSEVPPEWSIQALEVYAAALGLDPSREDIRREREVVVAAEAHRRGQTTSAPTPTRDSRSSGLFSFLTGDEPACRAAWEGLDLAFGRADPLVDAALGQMLLQRDQAGPAYPRLHAAVQAFPEAGFLLVDLADAAQRCGDVDKALIWLRLARERGLMDKYATDLRIEGECLARQGDLAGARRLFESVTARFGAPTCRSRFATLAEREGRFAEAIRLRRQAFEHCPTSPRFARELLASVQDLWQRLTEEEKVRDLAGSFDGVRAGKGLIRGLLAATSMVRRERRRSSGDSATKPESISSPEEWTCPSDIRDVLEIHFMLTRLDRPIARRNVPFLLAVARAVSIVSERASLPARGALRLALASAVFAACLPVPSGAQTSWNFEFNQPGVLPTATPGVGNFGTGGFGVSCGQLQQRTPPGGPPPPPAGLGWQDAFYLTPAGFSVTPPAVLEARIRILSTFGPFGCFLELANLTHHFGVSVLDSGIAIWSQSAQLQFIPVPNMVGIFHDYRAAIIPDAGGDLAELWMDGALIYGPALSSVGFNQDRWWFGNGQGLSWADVDWEYVRIHRGAPCTGPGQANSDAARLEINGTGVGNCRGPFTLNGVSGANLAFTWSGPPGMPFLLAFGPPNPANNAVGCLGRIDIGTPPFYPDLIFVMDGTIPFYSLFYTLDPLCGISQQVFSLPPLPPGTPIGGFQGLVLQPPGGACAAVLTAAWYLSG